MLAQMASTVAVCSSSASSSSSYLIHHTLFRPPPSIPPSSSSSFFFLAKNQKTPITVLSSSSSRSPNRFSFLPPLFSNNPSLALDSTSQLTAELTHNDTEEGDLESDLLQEQGQKEEEEEGEEEIVKSEGDLSPLVEMRRREPMAKLPNLTVKEKKELASYAHSLGKKLKSQQVGKSGVTDSVVTALIETLEANELLKLKIHGSCPDELDEAVKRLEEGTGSVMVSRIGRTIIIYRPSPTKLKVDEKRKLNQIEFQKKRLAFKAYNAQRNRQQKQQEDKHGERGPKKLYGRGRRGISRMTSSSSSSSY